MGDGSYLAFFDAPDEPFEFKQQRDFDLHIALEVDYEHMLAMKTKGENVGIETRGVADHGFIHSIYFRDPNGYVIELTTPVEGFTPKTEKEAHEALTRWQDSKTW